MPNLVTLDVIDRPIGGVGALSEGLGREGIRRSRYPRPPPGAGQRDERGSRDRIERPPRGAPSMWPAPGHHVRVGAQSDERERPEREAEAEQERERVTELGSRLLKNTATLGLPRLLSSPWRSSCPFRAGAGRAASARFRTAARRPDRPDRRGTRRRRASGPRSPSRGGHEQRRDAALAASSHGLSEDHEAHRRNSRLHQGSLVQGFRFRDAPDERPAAAAHDRSMTATDMQAHLQEARDRARPGADRGTRRQRRVHGRSRGGDRCDASRLRRRSGHRDCATLRAELSGPQLG